MGVPVGNFGSLDDLEAASAPPDPATTQPTDQQTIVPPQGFSFDTRPPLVDFTVRQVAPPSELYLGLNDLIGVAVSNSRAGLTSVTVTIRVLMPEGSVAIQTLLLNGITADRSVARQEFSLAECFILDLNVNPDPAAVPSRGQTYVQISIERPGPPFTNGSAILVSDYISGLHTPTWPHGEFTSSIDGGGFVHPVVGAVPAAGAEAIIQCPTNCRWRVLSASASLQASAAVGNRFPNLLHKAIGTTVFRAQTDTAQTAGQGMLYQAAPGLSYKTIPAVEEMLPLPHEVILRGTDSIGTFTPGLDVADQWTGVTLLVEEWIDL